MFSILRSESGRKICFSLHVQWTVNCWTFSISKETLLLVHHFEIIFEKLKTFSFFELSHLFNLLQRMLFGSFCFYFVVVAEMIMATILTKRTIVSIRISIYVFFGSWAKFIMLESYGNFEILFTHYKKNSTDCEWDHFVRILFTQRSISLFLLFFPSHKPLSCIWKKFNFQTHCICVNKKLVDFKV